MRIGRVADGDGWTWAELRGDTAHELGGAPFDGIEHTGRSWATEPGTLLAPVVPGKIIGVGRNYRAEDEPARVGPPADPGEPLVFAKPPSSVIGPGEPIVLPPGAAKVDFEGELAVVIGARCRSVPRERAFDVVFGYTVGNDVTSRDHQKSDGQWTRAKGFDTFCPLGPWIETELDAVDVEVTTTVDEVVRQKGRTSSMIHDIPALIEWWSAVMTLEPGDVLLSGTPAGTDRLVAGNRVGVAVEGIGVLTNPVTHGETS